MCLEDKTVLLTGALGTLGRAQARKLANAGAKLLLLDRPELLEMGEQFARDFSDARYVGVDLNDLPELKRVASEFDQVDILINNAALIINRPFQDFSIVEYEEQVRVNSTAGFVLAQSVTPAMKSRRYGKIINFCSLTLNGRWDGYVPYVASKGAMLGLTRTLARELGPHGIRVNAVSPGAVVSEAEERVFGDKLAEYDAWILENQCLKSRIQPEHVAELVVFLASAQSDMITGQEFRIDGGW